MKLCRPEDRFMSDTGQVDAGRRRRQRWPVSKKLEIVQLTMKSGASVAEVARAHGINANQLFSWRRAFQRGDLSEPCGALVPVRISSSMEPPDGVEQASPSSRGSIHIEFPGRALISVESGADSSLLRSILESLSK